MTARAFRLASLTLLAAALPGRAQEQAPMPPHENLPPHITRLTWFGERADFSHDGRRVLFLSKTFGDAMEVEIETGIIRNLTAHHPHYGYTRALYLSNGHILLSGPTEFDPDDPGYGRTHAWLFVLDPESGEPPHALDVLCSEGPAVSRSRLRIAWTQRWAQLPDEMPRGASRMYEGDIVYEGGAPRLVDPRLVLDSETLDFEVDLETQNFRPPDERELIFSAYGYQGTEVFGVDLETGELTNYSSAPGVYAEPEGIFPSGDYITVESDLHQPEGWHLADVYRLALDGSGAMDRLTYFAEVPTYRGSNPVVSDDGRHMAFQMARAGEAAGVGFGIFLYDFDRARTPLDD
jgi:hypothetical protein